MTNGSGIFSPRLFLRYSKAINHAVHHDISKKRMAIAARLPSQSCQAQAMVEASLVAILSGYQLHLASSLGPPSHPPTHASSASPKLPPALAALVDEIILILRNASPYVAANEIATIYETLVPAKKRTANGIFYTPPGLAYSLIRHIEAEGPDWASTRILEPACGAGVLFLRLLGKKRQALASRTPARQLEALARTCLGLDTDPFAVWLCQSLAGIILHDLCLEAQEPCPILVRNRSFLDKSEHPGSFDIIAGNPPYGLVTGNAALIERFEPILSGRANLYALFLAQAIECTSPSGMISMLIPMSLLSGHSFRKLRSFILSETRPCRFDIVKARKNVFESVQQDTMIMTLRKDKKPGLGKVYSTDMNGPAKLWRGPLAALSEDTSRASPDRHLPAQDRKDPVGRFRLPNDPEAPWLLPRIAGDDRLVSRLILMPTRLADWGLTISTGPVLWNRQKANIRHVPSNTSVPLIYAEAIRGQRLDDHQRDIARGCYLDVGKIRPSLRLVNKACILIKRTTNSEQSFRIAASELDERFLKTMGGSVAVENHVNILSVTDPSPLSVRLSTIVTFLTSKILDRVFRCQSGTASVSAFELNQLPVPSLDQMREIERIILQGAEPKIIEKAIESAYFLAQGKPLSPRPRTRKSGQGSQKSALSSQMMQGASSAL